MDKLRKMFDMSFLNDDNLILYVRKRFIYAFASFFIGLLIAIESHNLIIFLLFFILALIVLLTNAHVLAMCKNDTLKILKAECIERVNRNIKEHEFRSFYLLKKDNLYYKLYSSKIRYAPGNNVTLYVADSNVVYDNKDTFIILSVLLAIKEKTNNKKVVS